MATDKAGCDHWFQTTERNGKWVTECEYCHEIRPEASTAEPEPATSAEAIAEKMVFRVFYDDEGEHKLCILNHLGHGGYICFETGDDDSEVDDVRHRIVEALKFYVAPLQAKLSTLEQALRKIDDLDVLIQAADYLRQAGGGPMEDRLRLLHENLTAMSGESRQ